MAAEPSEKHTQGSLLIQSICDGILVTFTLQSPKHPLTAEEQPWSGDK